MSLNTLPEDIIKKINSFYTNRYISIEIIKDNVQLKIINFLNYYILSDSIKLKTIIYSIMNYLLINERDKYITSISMNRRYKSKSNNNLDEFEITAKCKNLDVKRIVNYIVHYDSDKFFNKSNTTVIYKNNTYKISEFNMIDKIKKDIIRNIDYNYYAEYVLEHVFFLYKWECNIKNKTEKLIKYNIKIDKYVKYDRLIKIIHLLCK